MKALAELLILVVELFEAEARAFRKGIIRLGTGVLLLVVGGTLLVGGTGLLIWAFCLYLIPVVGLPTAALLSGFIVFLIAGGLIWGAKRAVS